MPPIPGRGLITDASSGAAFPFTPAGTWAMALSWPERVELLLYGAAFICGIISAASLTVGQGEFGGQCILYGTASYNETDKVFSISAFSRFSLCYFVSAISVLIALYCFTIVLYWVYASCVDDIKRGSIWLTISLVVSTLVLFFLLVSACILRIGRDTLCESILNTKQVQSCSQAQEKSWKAPSDGSRFYINLHSAETSAWVNMVFWIIILALLVVQHRKESASGTSTFRPLAASDPEWATGETDAIFGTRPQRQ
ncbi:transmembrane protein 179B [Ambystoma mexicanum]|uniref:transmembrane protein 179B n=1 Tax=Ambystoma mexicanum TaxID=8296 RepID=UPI0037E74DBA